ncbi:hypothetical protein F4802DRAFT_544131 [Xylaria palmicola]|nr:hypothetical protein F4802DRAFT_544131 [Xylaria palmicola]
MIADTKFGIGLGESTDEIVVIDEILTPDYPYTWLNDRHEQGREQESLDKEPLRDCSSKTIEHY